MDSFNNIRVTFAIGIRTHTAQPQEADKHIEKNHPTHTCAQSDVVRLLVGKFDVAPRRKNWIANQPTPFAIDWIERRLQLFGYPSKELNLFSTFP